MASLANHLIAAFDSSTTTFRKTRRFQASPLAEQLAWV